MVGNERVEVGPRTAPSRVGTLRVGLLQTAPLFGEVDANIEALSRLHTQLGEVDLVLTPELALNGYGFAHAPDSLAADDQRLVGLASHNSAMGIGYAQTTLRAKPTNSYAILNAGARHVQHKIHPVSMPPWNEHLVFEAGARLDTVLIHGATCAVVICNDMWHPVVPWLAAQSGAEVLIVPVASADSVIAGQVQRTWSLILEHAATLLQCYVVFINRCGTDSGARFWGGSRVLAPDGTTIAEMGDAEGVLEATLDLGLLRELRAQTPILAEARTGFVLNGLFGLSTLAGPPALLPGTIEQPKAVIDV